MGVYAIARLTTNTTSGAAAHETYTTSVDRFEVREVGAFLNAATASTYGIGRPAAIGVTPTSPVLLLGEDPGDAASTVNSALAWGTGPTVPANFFRRIAIPANVGAGFILNFPLGLIIAVSASIVLWNLATNGAVNTHVAGSE